MLPIASNRPLVHGHRGCRGLRPENTVSAFLYALQLGVDVLELDVVISADQQVVVSHEPWLSSTICLDEAGQPIEPGNEARHNLYQMPYAAIRRCDCGLRPHPNFPEQLKQPAHKPLLREVLAAVEAATQQLGRPRVGYSVELKSEPAHDEVFQPAPTRFLDLVLAELQAFGVLPRTTLLCFDARVLRLVRQQAPNIATCLLLEAWQPWHESIAGLGFLPTILGPDFSTVTAGTVTILRAAFPTLQLVPWTVNKPTDMQQVLTWGVNGITTDYPDRLLRLFK